MTAMRRALALVVVFTATLTAAPPASADDDDRDDVRVRGTCTASTEFRLRVRADDGRLRVEFELDNRAGAARWQIVVLHERRIAWRGTRFTPRRGSARLRMSLADWFGTDTVSVRAVAPRGETCRAAVTVT